MNILVVGNGFDLAHDFPTRYTDFLVFLHELKDYYNNFYINNKSPKREDCTDKMFYTFFNDLVKKNDFKDMENVYNMSNENLWVIYFNAYLENKHLNLNNSWIDFEREISNIVKILDSANKNINHNIQLSSSLISIDYGLASLINLLKKDYNISTTDSGLKMSIVDFSELKEILISDLNKLIYCFEIYLTKYINTLTPKFKLNEILSINDNIDAVLSFNYTDTFERCYNKNVQFDYIHGKAKPESSIDTCQLVLGIDEFLNKIERDKNIDFVQYRKFFQRILKRTGSNYKKWIESYTNDNSDDTFNIFIFGHSLGNTDGDILRELFKVKNSKIKIFYKDKRAYENQIINLVQVIGQSDLISSVYGTNPKIEFIEQNNTLILDDEVAHNDIISNTFKSNSSVNEKYFDNINKYIQDIDYKNNKSSLFKNYFYKSLIDSFEYNKALDNLDPKTLKFLYSYYNDYLKNIDFQKLNDINKTLNPNLLSLISNYEKAFNGFNPKALKTSSGYSKYSEEVYDSSSNDDSKHTTKAAHNDYIDEANEKENIELDFNEMDNQKKDE